MSKYKIILLTIYHNLASYKALSENKIYEIKAYSNTVHVFKPFEIVYLANTHDKHLQKSKKKVFFLFLKKKTMA